MAVFLLATMCEALIAGELAVLVRRRPARTGPSAPDALHAAGQAARELRGGLTPAGARRAAERLRPLFGPATVAVTDRVATLATDGRGHPHPLDPYAHGSVALAAGRLIVLGRDEMACPPGCPIRTAVVVPLGKERDPVGALVVYARKPSADLARTAGEVAAWIGEELALGSAELTALRAQISPHFLHNSLAAVATLMRTDPVRARELLLDFADFTRYAFRPGRAFATLRDELRNTERYLALEQARYGDRLTVSLRIAPRVLPVAVPVLVLQPLVENAVRHGLETGRETVTVAVTAAGEKAAVVLTVEDDGPGADPAVIGDAIAGQREGVGLSNIDARLRRLFGDRHGLVVETTPGAGTRVTVRIPR